MKKKLFVAVLVVMLTVCSLAAGGKFLGIKPIQASTQTSGNIYTYEYNGQIYESDLSEDDAWTKAMLDQVEHGNLTMDDVEIEYLTFGSRGIIEIPQNIIPMSGGTSLTGNVEWQPSTGADYLPLQRVKVELYMHWGNFAPLKVDETYTTDNGYYSFDNFSLWEELAIIAFGPIGAVVYRTYSVRIYPESETFRVAKDWVGVNILDSISDWVAGVIPNWLAYYVSSSTGTWLWQSSGNFGTIQIPYNASGANETHNAFYISQALVMGQRFVQDVRGYSISKFLNVLYPFSDELPFSFDVFMGMGRSYFNDWQTALHEYGHFIQHNIGTNNISIAEYALYNPNHYQEDDHTASKKNGGKGNKDFGIKLAWTEAWAEAFSFVVIDHFISGYYEPGQALGAGGAGVKKIDRANFYNNWDPKQSDEPGNYGYNSGEGQERAIIALLWNLYQQQYFGQDGFWDTTTLSGTYTLTDFVDNLYTQYPEYRSIIGTIMSKFKIAPEITNSTYEPGSSTPPTITLVVNGSQYNPNNQFRIVFYNLDGEQKYETENVSFSLTPAASPKQNRRDLDTASYTLSQQEFNEALEAFTPGESIHIAVKGYRTGSPVTGPYCSSTIPEIPELLSLSSLVFTPINNDNEYSVTNILDKEFEGIVEIPSTYNGKSVTRIGASAFSGCTQLTQITIPSSVTSVGASAFANCTNLTINILDRTQIPSTWDSNFNSSNLPVSFDGELCKHLNGGSYTILTNSHIFRCLNCWHKVPSEHTMISDIEYEECECGYKLCLGGHDIIYESNQDGRSHTLRCDDCNYIGSIQRCLSPAGPPGSIKVCVRCGQTVTLPGGGILFSNNPDDEIEDEYYETNEQELYIIPNKKDYIRDLTGIK